MDEEKGKGTLGGKVVVKKRRRKGWYVLRREKSGVDLIYHAILITRNKRVIARSG